MQSDNLFQRILSIEEQADQIADGTQQERTDILEHIEDEINEIRDRYQKETSIYLERFEAEQAQVSAQQLLDLDRHMEESLQRVDSIYAEKRDLWINTIVDRITGRTEA